MKNTLKAITLAMVLTFGATFANAGITILNKPASTSCVERKGLLVSDRPIISGILFALAGLLVSDSKTGTCVESKGLLVSD